MVYPTINPHVSGETTALVRKTIDSADAVPPEIEKPLVVHEEIPEASGSKNG